MWSVGCLLAEMALTMLLFKESSEIDLLLRIFRLMGSPDPELIIKFEARNTNQTQKLMVIFPAWTPISLQYM